MKTKIMILAAGIVIGGGILYVYQTPRSVSSVITPVSITLGDMIPQLEKLGVIDSTKFNPKFQKGPIIVTKENEHELLNVLWAVGLANKNPILEKGPMMDPRYGGAKGFASTGGWTLAKGDTMSHYSMHSLITLTSDQQTLVEQVSKNIYRPCCDNSTYFPDCNHGMAMLGLLEMMAAQGATESDLYKTALAVNSYWFPAAYEVIAESFAKDGIAWDRVDPKLALSAEYSSGSGYARLIARLNSTGQTGGGSCGV